MPSRFETVTTKQEKQFDKFAEGAKNVLILLDLYRFVKTKEKELREIYNETKKDIVDDPIMIQETIFGAIAKVARVYADFQSEKEKVRLEKVQKAVGHAISREVAEKKAKTLEELRKEQAGFLGKKVESYGGAVSDQEILERGTEKLRSKAEEVQAQRNREVSKEVEGFTDFLSDILGT